MSTFVLIVERAVIYVSCFLFRLMEFNSFLALFVNIFLFVKYILTAISFDIDTIIVNTRALKDTS